uniref:Uncharacterized protein n=1 Tax=Octopus bimaculoides TaxID=37653 RepID=A0A0L8FNS5_OCTBM
MERRLAKGDNLLIGKPYRWHSQSPSKLIEWWFWAQGDRHFHLYRFRKKPIKKQLVPCQLAILCLSSDNALV